MMIQHQIAKVLTGKTFDKNAVVHFPIVHNRSVVDASKNMQDIKRTISEQKGRFSHSVINFSNFVVYEQPLYNFCEDIIKTAVLNDQRLSVELPNEAKTGELYDISLQDMVMNKYNKNCINVFKVYHFNNTNYKQVSFSLSENIRKSLYNNIGVHIRQDMFEQRNTDYFVKSCHLALANCYDSHKNIEVMIELNNDKSYEALKASLKYYGHDMYYKIKLVVSPTYTLRDNMGLTELQIVPAKNDWLAYASDMKFNSRDH